VSTAPTTEELVEFVLDSTDNVIKYGFWLTLSLNNISLEISRAQTTSHRQLVAPDNEIMSQLHVCSEAAVTSHIIVFGTCVRRHGTKMSTCKVHIPVYVQNGI
jgi:hypothetical protein